jgi:hypothetical protein
MILPLYLMETQPSHLSPVSTWPRPSQHICILTTQLLDLQSFNIVSHLILKEDHIWTYKIPHCIFLWKNYFAPYLTPHKNILFKIFRSLLNPRLAVVALNMEASSNEPIGPNIVVACVFGRVSETRKYSLHCWCHKRVRCTSKPLI